MPTPNESVDTRIAQGFDNMAAIEQREMERARVLVKDLHPDVASAWRTFEEDFTVGTVLAEQKAKRELAAQMSSPSGVGRQIAQDSARTQIAAAYAQAQRVVDAVLPKLEHHALPKIEDPAARAEAVAEVQMLVGQASQADALSLMQKIAGGSERRHAAVVASSWGKARLGGDEAAHLAVRTLAAKASAAHGTETEKRHLQALERLQVHANKAILAGRTRTTQRLGL